MITGHYAVPGFASIIGLFATLPLQRTDLSWVMFGITLFAGLTMVTNIPYYSFKDFRGKRTVPFTLLVLVVLVIALINIEQPTVMFGFFVCYGLSGYIIYVWRKTKGEHVSIVSTSITEPDEHDLHH